MIQHVVPLSPELVKIFDHVVKLMQVGSSQVDQHFGAFDLTPPENIYSYWPVPARGEYGYHGGLQADGCTTRYCSWQQMGNRGSV